MITIASKLPAPLRELLKRLIHIVQTVPYFGTERYCPVCGKSSRKFRPYGCPPRKEAKCVYCMAVERHRLLWLFLKHKTDLFDGKTKEMLHIAPESCFEPRFKRAIGDGYLTADLYNNAMVKMDITNIEYPDQSFDVIYCSHVLEHVLDDSKAMSEFYRVLKSDGWAILLVPIGAEKTYEDPLIVTPQDRLKAFGQEDHVRLYGPDYVDRLRAAGFKVEIAATKDLVKPTEANKMGLTNTEANGEIYYCTK